MSTDNHVCKAVRQKSAQMFTISPKIRYREQMEKNSHALGFNGSGSSRKCDIQVNFAGGCAGFPELSVKSANYSFILLPRFLQFLEIWFEKSGSRNLVREKRFCKIGFFSASRNVVDQKKMGLYTINPPYFRLEKSGSAESDFFFWFEKSG